MSKDFTQHRPGNLKQQNKKHNAGKHRSKRELERVAKGRQDTQLSLKRSQKCLNKQERRLQSKHIRERKRSLILGKKRNIGNNNGPPILISVLLLNDNIKILDIIDQLHRAIEIEEGTIIVEQNNHVHLSMPRFKKRLEFVFPEKSLMNILDLIRIADITLLIVDETGIGSNEERLFNISYFQGMQSILPTIRLSNNVNSLYKKKNFLKDIYGNKLQDQKIYNFNTDNECLQVIRLLCNMKIVNNSINTLHPHLLAEDILFEENSYEKGFGTLNITGYLRGNNLSANSLLHLPGFGDYGIKVIKAIPDPHNVSKDNEMSQVEIIQTCNYDQRPSLNPEAEVDSMNVEQTWPTEEELADAEKQSNKKKRVPKGTSSYQASWIIESDDSDDSNAEISTEYNELENDKILEMDFQNNDADDSDISINEYENEESEEISIDNEELNYDNKLNQDDEDKYEKEWKEARSDELYPDEIDTPHNVSAKERFQKYRGLKSFRTSPWNAKENLPLEYARIFHLSNVKHAKNKAIRKLSDSLEGAVPGSYICISIENFESEFADCMKNRIVSLFGLLKNENCMTVQNLLLKRSSCSGKDPIRNKTQLVFQVGFRRYWSSPIFSQHTNCNKHKMERFFRPDSIIVATVYAPITYGPCAALAFRMRGNGQLQMVGNGTLLSINPDRIICKRIVLSGHPFRINQRTVVVRYMFFNRNDILWFKPIELRTKHGRRGHIMEPLGTHGHMKCIFDSHLKSMDTVLLTLYKRVFPKWTYDRKIIDELVNTSEKRDNIETMVY